ncbi:hypothetical protein LCGC14_1600880, partial [marine sediment metagenome]
GMKNLRKDKLSWLERIGTGPFAPDNIEVGGN